MEDIKEKSGNKSCIICGGKNPTWGCFPFGVLCCTKCSGSFRELGTSVCTVKSLLLDTVSEEYLAPFKKGGNGMFLSWYGKAFKEDLSPAFFKKKDSQGYLELLNRGEIKEEAARSAPASSQPLFKHKSKLQAIEKESEDEYEDAPSKREEKRSEERVEEEPEKEPERKTKKPLKRSVGKIQTEGNDGARLGMFKNIEKEEAKPEWQKNMELRNITRGESYTSSASTPEGRRHVENKTEQEETVTDKIKKGLEKGKKTIFRTFKK